MFTRLPVYGRMWRKSRDSGLVWGEDLVSSLAQGGRATRCAEESLFGFATLKGCNRSKSDMGSSARSVV